MSKQIAAAASKAIGLSKYTEDKEWNAKLDAIVAKPISEYNDVIRSHYDSLNLALNKMANTVAYDPAINPIPAYRAKDSPALQLNNTFKKDLHLILFDDIKEIDILAGGGDPEYTKLVSMYLYLKASRLAEKHMFDRLTIFEKATVKPGAPNGDQLREDFIKTAMPRSQPRAEPMEGSTEPQAQVKPTLLTPGVPFAVQPAEKDAYIGYRDKWVAELRGEGFGGLDTQTQRFRDRLMSKQSEVKNPPTYPSSLYWNYFAASLYDMNNDSPGTPVRL
jgi:hypothetical protein